VRMIPWGMTATAVVSALVLLLAACGGGATSSPSPTTELSKPCERLAQAVKFRYTFTYTLDSPQPEGDAAKTPGPPSDFALQPSSADFSLSQELEGAVESPKRVDINVKTGDSPELRLVFLDGEEWVNLGGRWTQRPPDPVPFPAVDVCDAVVSSLDLKAMSPSQDTVDGVKASLYESDAREADIAAAIFGSESDMGRLVGTYAIKVWLTEDGDPLLMEASGTGTYPAGGREISVEISLALRDIGDSGIKVERPA